jgi:hypothetical protein
VTGAAPSPAPSLIMRKAPPIALIPSRPESSLSFLHSPLPSHFSRAVQIDVGLGGVVSAALVGPRPRACPAVARVLQQGHSIPLAWAALPGDLLATAPAPIAAPAPMQDDLGLGGAHGAVKRKREGSDSD